LIKNVKISESLFKKTIGFLEQLNAAGIYFDLQDEFNDIYGEFLKKEQSIKLRKDYSKIVCAKDDNSRFDARMQYLRNKRDIEMYY